MTLPGPDQIRPDQIRAAIVALNTIEKKVLGGMIVLMIKNHDRIKDREWLAENFTRLAVGAHGFAEEGAVDSDIATVSAFVESSMRPVLNCAFPLFSQVAVDIQGRAGATGFTLEDACAVAFGYFSDGSASPGSASPGSASPGSESP